jgi:diguanylate cyclase (GGDEF)-like protein
VVNYGTLPDLVAVALLTCAFASVARKCQAPGAGMWLTGWMLIALHFFASMFVGLPGAFGTWAGFIGLASLTWSATFFVRASLPYRDEPSSAWMNAALVAGNGIYVGALCFLPDGSQFLIVAALLFGLLPLAVAVVSIPDFQHPLRWGLVGVNTLLTIFLLLFQNRAGNGTELALNAVLFAAYFSCSVYFWQAHEVRSTGSLITTAGFLAWALVFVVAPLMRAYLPLVHVESEVWNLPKYVVATGMILLVLERQIEHNKYLALHDELTGLPNRRLFQDRMRNTLERARRSGNGAALLLVDLDSFKQVNDSLGHHIGDQLLRAVGDIFSHRLRRSDTVARTGGDEFAVILEEPVTRLDAERVAQQLSELIEQPIEVEGHTICIGASIGVALYPDDGVTEEAMFIAADLRMYDMKNGTLRGSGSRSGNPSPARSFTAEVAARGV